MFAKQVQSTVVQRCVKGCKGYCFEATLLHLLYEPWVEGMTCGWVNLPNSKCQTNLADAACGAKDQNARSSQEAVP